MTFCEIRFRGRYWGQSGHALLHCICPLMTQSGHRLLSGADFVKMPKIQLFKKIFASPKFPLLKNKGHFPSRLPPGAN
jgi:hypothetical protein